MNITIYVWKDNQEPLQKIEKKQELINKLLQVYFKKHGDEPVYTEVEPTA